MLNASTKKAGKSKAKGAESVRAMIAACIGAGD